MADPPLVSRVTRSSDAGRRRTPRRSSGGLRLGPWAVCLVALAPWSGAALHSGRSFREVSLVVRGATLLDGTGAAPVPEANLHIAGQRIRCADLPVRCPVPDGSNVLDGTGLWAIPGLIDTHVHLRWGEDFAEVQRSQRLRFTFGVTTVVDAGTHLKHDLAARSRAAPNDRPEPRIIVAGLIHGEDPVRQAEILVHRGVDLIKLKSPLSAPELSGVIEVAGAAHLPVYGHTWKGPPPESYALAWTRAGIDGITHLMGIVPELIVDWAAVPPIPHTEAGEAAFWAWRRRLWLYTDPHRTEVVIDSLVTASVWIEPTLLLEHHLGHRPPIPREVGYLGAPPTLRQLLSATDGGADRAQDDAPSLAEAQRRLRDFVRAYHEAGGVVLAGTDEVLAGPGLQEEIRLLRESGISAMDALKAATADAAEAVGYGDEIGTLETGKMADVVLLDADPLGEPSNLLRVRWVIKGGVLYDAEDLRRPWLDDYRARSRRVWRQRLLRFLPVGVLAVSFVGVAVLIRRSRRRRNEQ